MGLGALPLVRKFGDKAPKAESFAAFVCPKEKSKYVSFYCMRYIRCCANAVMSWHFVSLSVCNVGGLWSYSSTLSSVLALENDGRGPTGL